MRTANLIAIAYLSLALVTSATLATLYPRGDQSHWPMIALLGIAWPITWVAAIPFADNFK